MLCCLKIRLMRPILILLALSVKNLYESHMSLKYHGFIKWARAGFFYMIFLRTYTHIHIYIYALAVNFTLRNVHYSSLFWQGKESIKLVKGDMNHVKQIFPMTIWQHLSVEEQMHQEKHLTFCLTQVVAVSFSQWLGSSLVILFRWLVAKELVHRKWRKWKGSLLWREKPTRPSDTSDTAVGFCVNRNFTGENENICIKS